MEGSKLSLKKSLEDIWNNFTLDEIIDKGIEMRKISAADVLNLADDMDPFGKGKKFTDDDLTRMINQFDIDKIIDKLETKWHLYEILDCLDPSRILSNMDDDQILEYLIGSDVLDNYEADIKSKQAAEDEDYYMSRPSVSDFIDHLGDMDSNEIWRLICDSHNISYYDNQGFNEKLQEIIQKLNESLYKDKSQNFNLTLEKI